MVASRAREIRKKNRGKMNTIHTAQIQVLYQERKICGKELLKRFSQYSRSLIYHWVKKPINGKILVDQRNLNKGRPRKLSAYDERRVVSTVKNLWETMGHYTCSTWQWNNLCLQQNCQELYEPKWILLSPLQEKGSFDCHWPKKA